MLATLIKKGKQMVKLMFQEILRPILKAAGRMYNRAEKKLYSDGKTNEKIIYGQANLRE